MATPNPQGTNAGGQGAEPRMSGLYKAARLGAGVKPAWLEEIRKRLGPSETVLLTTTARTEYMPSSPGLLTFQGPRFGVKLLGLLVVTDARVILFAERPLHGYAMQEYPYANVTMVEEMRGWRSGGLRLHAANAMRELDLVPKEDAEAAVRLIRERMEAARRAPFAGPTPASQAASPTPLHALKLRLARGEIAPEEYERLLKMLEG